MTRGEKRRRRAGATPRGGRAAEEERAARNEDEEQVARGIVMDKRLFSRVVRAASGARRAASADEGRKTTETVARQVAEICKAQVGEPRRFTAEALIEVQKAAEDEVVRWLRHVGS